MSLVKTNANEPVREQSEHAESSEHGERFSLAREKPEPVGCLATLNPTNHIVAKDNKE